MFLYKLYRKIVSLPLRLLVNSKLLPDDPIKDLDIDLQSPIYYVLQRRSTSSFLMLKEKARKLNLPEPKIIEGKPQKIPNGAVFFLQNKILFGIGGKPVKKYQELLGNLMHNQKQNPQEKHQLIPVSIFWGRNPGKENSVLRLFFTDTENATQLRKLFLFVFQGRNTFVRIAKPVNMAKAVEPDVAENILLVRLTRILRVHFRRNHNAAMGPLISNRRQVITNILVSDGVRKTIEREAKSKDMSLTKAREIAGKYAREIASAYSYKMVRFLESTLTHFWNRVYDGVEVRNSEMVRELAATHEVIYVPCHRSHIDYLLLSYTIYHEGLVTPHIAAGINLNFWPAGPILRRAGAFFLRRSFGGNKLYTAVFNEYFFGLMNHGTPLMFFPEGGRSRTGRLLSPKTGLLAMTLQSCLRGTRKPVAIVPVYIGYERMFEGKSYLNELRGAEKKKESFGQLLGIRKTLKQAFGKVYLNFASPLFLNQYLDKHQPEWHQHKGGAITKPAWLPQQVNDLAFSIMEKINATATVNSVSLIALILLSTERYAIGRKELELQLELLIDLNQHAKYSDTTYLPDSTPKQLIKQAKRLGTIFSVPNPMGDIITSDEKTAVLLTYYRNNILHIYITSSLIASCFLNKRSMSSATLIHDLVKLFPLLKKELFLHWDELQFKQHIEQSIDVFLKKEMLTRQEDNLIRADESHEGFNQLFLHAQVARPTLLRYGTILTILSAQAGHQGIDKKELENRSQQLTQRIAALYSINAPESFDKNLFRNTVSVLRENELLRMSSENTLEITTELADLQDLILDKINVNSKYLMQKTAAWANKYWDTK